MATKRKASVPRSVAFVHLFNTRGVPKPKDVTVISSDDENTKTMLAIGHPERHDHVMHIDASSEERTGKSAKPTATLTTDTPVDYIAKLSRKVDRAKHNIHKIEKKMEEDNSIQRQQQHKSWQARLRHLEKRVPAR